MSKYILMIILVFCSLASAADWYVAADGNDANGGTGWDDAFATIQAGVDATSSGDTVYIGSGTYAETVDLDTGNKENVTLDGIDKTAIISHNNNAYGIIAENGTVAKNLTVNLTNGTAAGTSGFRGGKTGIVIENCSITGGSDGVYLVSATAPIIKSSTINATYDALSVSTATNVLVESCTISTDGTYGVATRAAAINAGNSTGSAVFRNCVISASRDDNSAQYVAGVYNWHVIFGGQKLEFYKCTITVSAGDDDSGNVYGVYSGSTNGITVMDDCGLTTSTTGSGTAYDFYRANGDIWLKNCGVNPASFYGSNIHAVSRSRARFESLYFDNRR